jgi:ABC-type phosphate/phosphonate transport system substrate-binding protein
MKHASAAIAVLAACLLAACATAPSPAPSAALTTATPEAMVAAIRAAAGEDDSELAVQPLRDPMVEDLRHDAQRLEAGRHYDAAAATLDRALVLVPEDPALLQERAEAALLLHDGATAERLAYRAYATGAKVGPLCRRHWATIEQVRLLAGDAAGAASAKLQIDACKVHGPNRY